MLRDQGLNKMLRLRFYINVSVFVFDGQLFEFCNGCFLIKYLVLQEMQKGVFIFMNYIDFWIGFIVKINYVEENYFKVVVL